MKNNIGVIGHGFVGIAVETGLQRIAEIRIHDKYKASESLEDVVSNCEVLFMCLPTPMDFETGKCNLKIYESVIKNIDSIAETHKTFVIKSTVPPGSTNKWQEQYSKHTFIFSPEFLTERNFINDFLQQDRIILGCSQEKQHKQYNQKVFDIFDAFVKTQEVPGIIYKTTPEVAEMVKYIGNCFLSTKVSFFNEIYQICEASGIDFDRARELACLDQRIGSSHSKVPNYGDFGFGGSCFPKDMNSLIFFAKSFGIDPIVLESVWSKNLLVRENYDWENLAQVNGNYKKQ